MAATRFSDLARGHPESMAREAFEQRSVGEPVKHVSQQTSELAGKEVEPAEGSGS